MAIVRKRSKSDSVKELETAIVEFSSLLKDEGEEEASQDLENAVKMLAKATVDSKEFKEALTAIKDCFEGDHELIAYTMRKAKDGEWSSADLLFLASTKVTGILRRFGS
jgi:hypothetical protein